MNHRESFFVSKIKGLARLNKKMKRPLAFFMLSAFLVNGLVLADTADFLRPRAAEESGRVTASGTTEEEKPPYERLLPRERELLDQEVIIPWALNYPHISKAGADKARNILAGVMLADKPLPKAVEKKAILDLIACFPIERGSDGRLYEDIVHILTILPLSKSNDEKKFDDRPLRIEHKELSRNVPQSVITETFEQPDYYSSLKDNDRKFIDNVVRKNFYLDNLDLDNPKDLNNPIVRSVRKVRNALAGLRLPGSNGQAGEYTAMNILTTVLPTIPKENLRKGDEIGIKRRADELIWDALDRNGLRRIPSFKQMASEAQETMSSI